MHLKKIFFSLFHLFKDKCVLLLCLKLSKFCINSLNRKLKSQRNCSETQLIKGENTSNSGGNQYKDKLDIIDAEVGCSADNTKEYSSKHF